MMNNQTMIVFTTPIKADKTDEIRRTISSNDEELTLFSEIEISKYYRWIQKIYDDYFLVHLIEGKDPKNSFEALRKKIAQQDPRALTLQQLYQDTLGIDLYKDDLIPEMKKVTELLSVDIEHDSDTLIKEYCFVYPLVPSKKEKLLRMYQDKAVYHSQQVQNIYRFRGISKIQVWIQETAEKPYIVLYQEITGPVSTARNKYLNSKEDELSTRISKEYSDITGLAYEELLPNLESLQDFEILKN